MAESADKTSIPIDTSIEDANGAIWTLRRSDGAVLKDGVASGISGVMQIWYLAHIVWAFKGTHWRYWTGTKWAKKTAAQTTDTGLRATFPDKDQDNFPTLPPSTFPQTAGLRYTTGPAVLASYAGVQISAGSNIQAVVDANPAGTTYVLAIGSYTSQTVQPKDYDQFVGLYNGTSGAVMNGNSDTNYAFGGSAHHVTIRNLFIQNYTNPTQDGAITNTYGDWWTVQSCSITGCTQGGAVNTSRNYFLCIACKLNDNAQQGYSVHGDNVQPEDGLRRPIFGILFDSNEISGNNPTGAQWDGSEQGGGKALNTQHLTFWFNDSNDNGGSNYWTDYDNIYTLYWANQGGPGGWNGIEHEISYNAKMLYNVFTDIGASEEASTLYSACVFIGNSGGVFDGVHTGDIEIAHNTMGAGEFGRTITLRHQSRTIDDLYNIANKHRWIYKMQVHHNAMDWSASVVTSGLNGLWTDIGSDFIYAGPDRVRFDYNTYEAGSNFDQLIWANSLNLDFPTWQSLGNDVHGTYNSSAVPTGWSTGAKNSHITISGTSGRIATQSGGVGATNYGGRGSQTLGIAPGQKKMFRCRVTTTGSSTVGVGVCDAYDVFGDNNYIGQNPLYNSLGYYDNGGIYMGGGASGGPPTFTTGDDLVFCVHGGNRVWIGKNAVPDVSSDATGYQISWLGTVFPAYTLLSGASVTIDPTASGYSPPAGYTTLV